LDAGPAYDAVGATDAAMAPQAITRAKVEKEINGMEFI
jgi:hypothetical protein